LNTKAWRYLRNATTLFLVFSFAYLSCGYFFIQQAQKEKNRSLEKFFGITPDLIVIFTGARGRIPYGISLAKKYKQSNILITGVYDKNNLQTLIEPLTIEEEINTNLIEIDYFANNTFENVLSTLRYLRIKKGFKNVLVVSHDYHLPRIKTIFRNMMAKEDDYRLYYIGVDSNYKTYRDYKVLYKEVYKYIRTYAFLTIRE
jgi:uncharacterized SAM-binding protein YcdF (DUF218 family)